MPIPINYSTLAASDGQRHTRKTEDTPVVHTNKGPANQKSQKRRQWWEEEGGEAEVQESRVPQGEAEGPWWEGSDGASAEDGEEVSARVGGEEGGEAV